MLPVNGLPLTVTRTYNSLNPDSADFGYGWAMALNAMDVTLDDVRTAPLTAGSDDLPFAEDDTDANGLPLAVTIRTGGDRNVTLTLPDGRRTTFEFTPGLMPGTEGMGVRGIVDSASGGDGDVSP